jgi:hypothetical protein
MKSENRGSCLLNHESDGLHALVPVAMETGLNPSVGLNVLETGKKHLVPFLGINPRIFDRFSRNRTRYRPRCHVYYICLL